MSKNQNNNQSHSNQKSEDSQQLQEARVLEFKAKLEGMTMAEIIELNPRLKEEIDLIVTEREEQDSDDGQEFIDEMNKVLEGQKVKIEELEKELSIVKAENEVLKKKSDVVVGSKVILSKDKLDKTKKYVTGPNGIGYVERA